MGGGDAGVVSSMAGGEVGDPLAEERGAGGVRLGVPTTEPPPLLRDINWNTQNCNKQYKQPIVEGRNERQSFHILWSELLQNKSLPKLSLVPPCINFPPDTCTKERQHMPLFLFRFQIKPNLLL